MNLRQIEAFKAVMEYGTVTRAAAVLHVSQPAVSRLVAYLEQHCGFRLFVRRSGRMIATREAELLHGEIRRIFAGLSDIRRVAADIRDLRFGQVAVAAFPGLALRLLPEVILRFRQAHPEVLVRLETKSSREVLDGVAAQGVDLGISTFATDHPAIRRGACYRWKAVCIMPRGHPLAARATIRAEDLRDQPFVSLGGEDRSRLPIDRLFDDRGIARRVVLEASLSESVCRLVAGGAGVALLDELAVAGFADESLVVRPFVPRLLFDGWILYPAHRQVSQMAEAFAGILDEALAGWGGRRQPAAAGEPNARPPAR